MIRLMCFLVMIVMPVVISCSRSNTQLHEDLMTAIKPVDSFRKGRYKIIDMKNLVKEEWDTLYIFRGETSSATIGLKIGSDWRGADVPNLHNRLAFVFNHEIVTYVDIYAEEFPLEFKWCDKNIQKYSRDKAVFITFKYCNEENGPYYALIPANCMGEIADYKQMVECGCEK